MFNTCQYKCYKYEHIQTAKSAGVSLCVVTPTTININEVDLLQDTKPIIFDYSPGLWHPFFLPIFDF